MSGNPSASSASDGSALAGAPPRVDLLVLSGASSIRTPAGLNHAIYAERHGLRYVFDVTPAAISLIYLHKIEAIRRHLAAAEWLFWIDDDAFFTAPDVDVRSFVPVDPGVDLVACASPVNPDGGWTWLSAGQLLVRNTAAMADLFAAVANTELGTVRAWWDAESLGLFTRGDQDLLVYQLRREDSPWAGRFEIRPWQAFNSRPYHYERRLDEHFICHFAVPGGRSKMDLIRDFAGRMGTTTALVPEHDLAPYRTFIERSEIGPLLGDVSATPLGAATSDRPTVRSAPSWGARVRRIVRAMRRRIRR